MKQETTLIARACGVLTGSAPWTGRVLSVHPRAINVIRSDGLVVSVVADPHSMSAMGVLAPELFRTPPDPALVDRPAWMLGSVITFNQVRSIDCAECPLWEGKVDATAVRMIPIGTLRAVRDALFAHGKPDGLLGVLRGGPAGNVFVTRVRMSLRNGKPEELVGCGPGLTPAGDDFLTGAILGSPGPGAVLPDRGRLALALAGTTPAGRTLLWMALQDRFPAYLAQLIDAISRQDVSTDAIENAVCAACAHGETSGTDALAGFCWQMLGPQEI